MPALYHPETKATTTVPDRSVPALLKRGWIDKSKRSTRSTAKADDAAPAATPAPEGASSTPNEGATS